MGVVGEEKVNCRIGSLEIDDDFTVFVAGVNCRIGSLEIARANFRAE